MMHSLSIKYIEEDLIFHYLLYYNHFICLLIFCVFLRKFIIEKRSFTMGEHCSKSKSKDVRNNSKFRTSRVERNEKHPNKEKFNSEKNRLLSVQYKQINASLRSGKNDKLQKSTNKQQDLSVATISNKEEERKKLKRPENNSNNVKKTSQKRIKVFNATRNDENARIEKLDKSMESKIISKYDVDDGNKKSDRDKKKTDAVTHNSQIKPIDSKTVKTSNTRATKFQQQTDLNYIKTENKMTEGESDVIKDDRDVTADLDYNSTVPDKTIDTITKTFKNIEIKNKANSYELESISIETYYNNDLNVNELLENCKKWIETIQGFWGPFNKISELKSEAEKLLNDLHKCQIINTTNTFITKAIKKVEKHLELLEERIPIIKTHESEIKNPNKEETLYYSEESREIMKISSQIISLYKKTIEEEWTKTEFQEKLKKCVNELENIDIHTEDKVANELKDDIIFFCNDFYLDQRIEIKFLES